MTLWQLTNQTHSQMMGYVMKTVDGKLIVLDGGMPGDAPFLLKMIKEQSPAARVDVWLLSHAHGDHYGALTNLLETNKSDFSIGELYYSFPTADILDKLESGGKTFRERWMGNLKSVSASVKTPKKNDVIKVGKYVTITVMNDIAPEYEKYTHGINDSSICYRVDTGKTSLLFTGDMGVTGGNHLLKSQPIEKLQCDYTQMAHHGQSGLNEEQYTKLAPKRCLWPTTDWIWVNDFGKGPGTGRLTTEQTKQWMKKLNVKEHYNAKDGLIVLQIP